MNSTFSITETVSKAWKAVKDNIWVLVGLIIGYAIISFTLSLFTGDSIVFNIISFLLLLVIDSLFNLGYLKNIFQALDGEEPQFSAYGQESRKILKYIGASLLFTIISLIGLGLFIIPGIYLSIRLQFFQAYIVDEDCGVIESLKRSWELTRGHAWSLFVLFLVMIFIAIIGLLLLVVGLFVAVPIINAMYLTVYRELNSPISVATEAIDEL